MRVLIAEDDRRVAGLLKNRFKSDHISADVCHDGQEALELSGVVRYDVIVLDIMMPSMDGLEAARAILEEDPSARIVMVSSLAYDDTFNEASQIGTKGFLYKPFSQKTLLEALEKAIQDS